MVFINNLMLCTIDKTVRWVSLGTEAGWRVPMPSSRRDGSEGKWMCPPFLTQAKVTQASLQCGTEGLLPATLIPWTIYSEKQQLRWYYKNRSAFNYMYRYTGYNITSGANVHLTPTKKMLYIREWPWKKYERNMVGGLGNICWSPAA